MTSPMTSLPPRIDLAMVPTPLQRLDRLSEVWAGPTIWVKRDDLTGFGLSGNKVRKLEFHLAAAINSGADTIVTMGAAQSNHCRATALACARLGLDAVLLLRTPDGRAPGLSTGNHLLSMLSGATVHHVAASDWEDLTSLTADLVLQLRTDGASPWVIPVGASDELGMWGLVRAVQELDVQLAGVPGTPVVWHAASSGGTTAGLGWGADRLGLDIHIAACSVDAPTTDLLGVIDDIWADALRVHGGANPTPHLTVTDDHIGLGYGRSTAEELATQHEVTALTGLLLDPAYTGKAIHGLRTEIARGRFVEGDHVVFWHTGGGFAVFAETSPEGRTP